MTEDGRGRKAMAYQCLKRYKDGGICQSLTGKIFWSFVYIEDPESGWSVTEKQKQEKTNLAVIRYLKDMAKQEHVSLQMFMKSFSVRLTCVMGKNNISSWTEDFAKSEGFSSLGDMDRKLRKQYPDCQNFYIFLANKSGRAFASPSVNAGGMDAEYCVVYRGDFDMLLHEVLHVFGAADLYYPEQVKQSARRILGKSVMMDSGCHVIDDLTKYLIGWHRSPSAKAQRLLDATAGITAQMVSEALEREDQNKNGFGRTVYSNGTTYEGNFKDGVADGTGTMRYADGSVYQGEIRMTERHGQGRLTYANGAVYEGDFQEGMLHGNGRYVYADGTTYEGEFRNGDFQGKGVMVYTDGTVYEGDFQNGSPQGYGKFIFTNGARYEGEIRNGKYHGKGCLVYSDGTEKKGYFENNEYKGNWWF